MPRSSARLHTALGLFLKHGREDGAQVASAQNKQREEENKKKQREVPRHETKV